jgi:hypothetical protein
VNDVGRSSKVADPNDPNDPSDGTNETNGIHGDVSRAIHHLFPLIVITLVVMVLFLAPLVRSEAFTFRDHSDYFQPLRFFTAMHLRAGRLPLWNPYSASGEPWLANPQTGVFYPPTWMFTAMPFPTAYMAYLALHLAILGWGAYALFVRSAAPGAALVGSVALILCGPTLSLLDVSNNFASFAWIPLVLWCAMERRSNAPRVPFAVDAFMLALAFLGGEPFLAAVAAAMYGVIVLWGETPSRLAKGLFSVAITGVTAFALTAVQALPFLEMVRGSDRRAGLGAEEIFRDSMAPGDWIRMAIRPHLLGGAYDPALAQHFIPIVYVGAVTMILALIGCLVTRVRGWLLLLAGVVVIGSGPALLAHLPLTIFRYPARVVPLGALALIALAVAGWDRIRPQRRWADLLVIGMVVIDLVTVVQPLLACAPFRPHPLPYGPEVGRSSKIVRLVPRAAVMAADRTAWMAGYLNLLDRRFDAWTAAPVIAEKYVELYGSAVASRSFFLADQLSVGWILSAHPPQSLEAFTPVARVRGVTAYHFQASLPFAYLRTIDGVPLPVQSLALDASSARVIAQAPRQATMILTQQDAPGWRVFVDGVERPKLIERGIFRAVAIPPGRHEIEWRYLPLSLRIGAAITLAALAWLAALWSFRAFLSSGRRTKVFFAKR